MLNKWEQSMTNFNMNDYKQQACRSLSSASALPYAVYHEPEVFELEVKKIFHQEWIFVCAETELTATGSYYAFSIADEPVVVLKTSTEKIVALSNVCRHRGTLLLDPGFGRFDKNITCPYHAWTYSDEGKLKAIPFIGDAKIDKAEHCLGRFSIEIWMGLIFVSLNNNPAPLNNRLKGLQDYLAVFEPQRFTASYVDEPQVWQANWKLAVENGIESYHLFKVHKETLEITTPTKTAYYVGGSSEWALNGGKIESNKSSFLQWFSGKYPEVYDHYLLIFLPPGFIGIMTYESFDWINILPLTSQSCQIIAGGFSTSNHSSDRITQHFVEQFLHEDKQICERVQSAMKSKKSNGGKLVSMEKILIDFRQYLSSRLFNTKPDCFTTTSHAALFLEHCDD